MATHPKPLAAASPEEQRLALGRAARLLASASDFRDTLRQTIGACLPVLGDFGFFDVLSEGGVQRTVAAHEAPEIEALLAPTQWVRQEPGALNLCALSSGQAALHADTGDAWYRRIAANDDHLKLMQELAFGSMITVPVRYRDELVGALTLFMGRSGRRHTPDDVAFASEIAMLAAPVVVNARLLEQQLQSEVALRTSEERLRMAVEAGQVGIWDWDIVNNRVTWSDRVYEMHEMQRGTDTGGFEGFRARVHPEDFGRVQESMSEALAGGPAYKAEFRTVLPGGRIRWIATQGHLVRDSQGKPLRMVGASTDVTERLALLEAERAARSQAEAARRRLELLAQAGSDHARSLDPHDTLQAIAASLVPSIADWCRIDVIDDDGILQRGLAYHVDPQRAAKALAMSKVMRAASQTVGSMGWVREHGLVHYGDYGSPETIADPDLREYTRTFGMRAHYVLPLVARGRVIGVMAVIQAESGRGLTQDDRALTEELAQRAALALDNSRLYAQAQAALRQAESANRAKDEFLAMLGHELRNPLAPIATALEVMARRDPGVGVQERHVIGRQVRHLSRLIDDLLDISRITQGKIQLQDESVDLRTVVQHALELTRPVFEAHVRPVAVSLPEAPAVVQGDPVRLSQVVCNLLVNAAKFTPPTGRVALSLVPHGAGFEISVEDSGSGIGADLLPRVFDLFVQGHQRIDRSSGGLGLGLAIVRSLVELHGGSVAAHSEGEGKGSRFTVRLPAGTGPAEVASELPGSANPGSGRLLVVDDNQDAAQTLAELLRMSGYEVRTAGDAHEALAVVTEFAPALALLDIGLPGIDGYQLAAMVRARPNGRKVKLVALTGYGRDNDRALAMQAGFEEHLVKPVDVDRLFEVIAQLLGER